MVIIWMVLGGEENKMEDLIILTIGKGVKCENLPIEAKRKISKDLTFENPIYKNAERRGGYVGINVMEYLYFYEVSKDKQVFWIPRGYVYYLMKWIRQNNLKVKIIDKTLLLPKMNIKFHGKLRDYQELAVNEMVNRYPIGVLEAQTGAGKTVIATGVIARRKQPTLIIVHSKELLYQWQEAIKTFLHYDCGLLGDGKNNTKDITVGIINTVKNKTEELKTRFGQIIVDETHKVAATSWSDTLQEFPARHYLGLSATTFRSDGLGDAIFAHIGHKIHKVDKKMLTETGAVLVPEIYRIETSFRHMFLGNYSGMIKKLVENETRNNLICSKIAEDFKQHKENILVVSDRKKHCIAMQQIITDRYNLKSNVLIGSVNATKRKQIVEDAKSGKCKILFATTSLIGEGFDLPDLTALFLSTPLKFSGRILQAIGRILRPTSSNTNKKPRVYDFRDNDIDVLRNTGYHRDRVYRKQWGK